MLEIFKKEIRSFFSSLIAYIVIIVFLVVTGLLMWVAKDNTLETGYANMDVLFIIAPWVFIFLISAITMRTFSEERRTGTIEFLTTKPITDLQIIVGKYLAGVMLVIFALLPTLLFYYTVYELGSPKGNIDSGATLGSYIGLILLASAFVSIGLFSSAISDNQIVAFILSMFFCALFYIAFKLLSALPVFAGIDYIIEWLGIYSHYQSVSRGVLDSRDVMYFISLILLFILLTRTALESRKW